MIDTQVFQINKNRLRGNNITRWSSAFLLLNSFYKAYKKNIFTDENKCPVTLAEIEFYIELLLPAYRFTLLHQRTAANIAEVVPTLQMLIKKYEQFAKDTKKRPFSEALIKHIKVKFEYEFESNIYAVAAYMDTTQLHDWSSRSFAVPLLLKAKNSLQEIANEMLFTRSQPVTEAADLETNSNSKESDQELFSNYFALDDSDSDIPTIKTNKLVKLKEEAERYHIMTQNPIKEKSTRRFWQNKANELPILYELACILLNIPSSSSYVERFFSVCGIVNRQRAGNMNNSTLINRAFLKVNLDLVNRLNNE